MPGRLLARPETAVEGPAGAANLVKQKRCNMQVFIMRHGDAALDAASDAVRPLTHCGIDETRQMATWLKSQRVAIDHVLASPYLRAEQTLAAVNKVMTLSAETDVLPELTPGGDAEEVAARLHVLADRGVKCVLVISHLPLVGYLVSELCPHEAPPMFCTSAIASITLEGSDNKGTFNWQMSPCNLKMPRAM